LYKTRLIIPETVEHNNIKSHIIDESFLSPPYVIFQEIINNNEEDMRSIHMVKLNLNDPISMGRGLKNEIRVNDITISRIHCFLKVTKYGLFIQDFKSKFGTLVMQKKPFEICKSNNSQIFQIGKAFMKPTVTTKWKLFELPNYIKNPRTYKLKNYEDSFNWVGRPIGLIPGG
jgi:hypothetical protein